MAEKIINMLQNPLIEKNEKFMLEGNEYNAQELTKMLQDVIQDEEDESDSDFSL